jgi:leucyl-tRNA synthetase
LLGRALTLDRIRPQICIKPPQVGGFFCGNYQFKPREVFIYRMRPDSVTHTDEYNPQAIEARWQQRWAETRVYRTPQNPRAPTFYCLDFFPYPSGAGLSVGHGRNYVPSDVISRYYRMKGNAVLHPMGWDAFGLPAENEAIKKGIHPRETTARYAANYRRQMTLMGCSYDWEREINSSTPEYYRWTQWFFLLLYRRGLAYRGVGSQWWCPDCKTVLADEQIEDSTCWRCHGPVHKRDLEQWYFNITAYADELLADLETLDWPDHILAMQRHWIGRSEGIEFELPIADVRMGEDSGESITVYTTRPDTVYGMSFAALAPEHPLVAQITTPERRAEVSAYCETAAHRSEIDRLQLGRDGVFTGAYAINPLNGVRVPVYVTDYVLMGHGGGAIMAVPAHDARDSDFAQRHSIPAPVVIAPPDWDGEPLAAAYTDAGVMVNSGPLDGLPSDEAKKRIAEWMKEKTIGRPTVQYRMRDWLISRQRYWGAPIPIVHCDGCGVVPVPEGDLPVLLPHVESWLPGEDGRSPLTNIPEFVHTTCPRCGGPAQRETDTMDGFACSSWYFLRFVSPGYEDGPFDPTALAQWGPPDLYVGGAEHAVMHLLYARFWTKVMADAGVISFREPFPALRSQGVMHARDPKTGEIRRMSKSAGNVVTPDSVAAAYGADALRICLLFMAPFENNTVWENDDTKGAHSITGAKRFLNRLWRLAIGVIATDLPAGSPADTRLRGTIHRTVERVTADVETFKFNTAVAALMECLNEMMAHHRDHGITTGLAEATRTFVLLVAPFAPHVAEELWERLGGSYSVHQQPWPTWDETQSAEEAITLVVQIDGKLRDRLIVPSTVGEVEARQLALACEGVRRYMEDRRVVRIVFVSGRLINIVTESVVG